MKNIFTKTLLLLCFFATAGPAFSQTPIEFNDKLVSVNDTLFMKGQEWGKKFTEVRPTKEYSKLAPLRMELENYIARKLQEVKNMKDITGSKEFREGMIDFLLFEKKMLDEGFKPMEKLSSSSTEEEVKTALNNLVNASKQESAKLETFRKLQVAFAEKNGFRIADQ